MVGRRNPTNQVGRLADRYAALAAGRAKPATGFVSQPEPRSIGLYARGKQLTAGNILLAGTLIEAPGSSLWDLAPDPAFVAEAQGFGWLDDLAAVGTPPRGQAGARLDLGLDRPLRHRRRPRLDARPDRPPDHPLDPSRHPAPWHAATACQPSRSTARSPGNRSSSRAAGRPPPPACAQFEALTGLVYAGSRLIGLERLVAPAATALAAACQSDIDAEGGIPTRNPEELLEVLTLLTWSARA